HAFVRGVFYCGVRPAAGLGPLSLHDALPIGGGIAVGVGRRIGEAVDEGAAGRQRLEQGAGGRVVDVAAVALQRQRRAGAERDWRVGGAAERRDLDRIVGCAGKMHGAGDGLGLGGGDGGVLREDLLGRTGYVDGDGGRVGIALCISRRLGESAVFPYATLFRSEQGAGGRVVDVAAVALQRQRRAGAERDWRVGGAAERRDLDRIVG